LRRLYSNGRLEIQGTKTSTGSKKDDALPNWSNVYQWF